MLARAKTFLELAEIEAWMPELEPKVMVGFFGNHEHFRGSSDTRVPRATCRYGKCHGARGSNADGHHTGTGPDAVI